MSLAMLSKQKKYLRLLSIKTLPLLILFAALLFNSYTLYKETAKSSKIRKVLPPIFYGNKFSALRGIFTDITEAGYYTDKNLDLKPHAAQFAQAQYMLTPTILDLNNTEHKYIIFDCTTEKIALKKIKEINAKPLKRSPFGIILAERRVK